MATPVLGKSLCSDWFFLGQDFAVRTISMETVQPVYFCFGAKPANSKFATKRATKKKLWILSFFTVKLQEEAWKIEIFPKFQRWIKKTNILQESFITVHTATTSGQYSPVLPLRSVSKRSILLPNTRPRPSKLKVSHRVLLNMRTLCTSL